ncbi:MAG: putative Ig domain-containing protein, partial [Thermoanaerobaculia bacterium]
NGLSLGGGGVIAGVPTAAGTFTFTVKVTDSLGTTKTAVLTITVVNPPLLITTTTLPNGVNGSAYSVTLLASGGAPPYSWLLASGTLPNPAAPAFAISSGGVISGTPSAAGTFSFTVMVTDSATPTANTATANLSITIP